MKNSKNSGLAFITIALAFLAIGLTTQKVFLILSFVFLIIGISQTVRSKRSSNNKMAGV